MSDALTDRTPPHNRDAERAVLGAIFRDPDVLADVRGVLRAEDFYFDAHRKIFGAVCDLETAGRPVELVAAFDALRTRNELADAGGTEYLVEIWEAVPTGANAGFHAQLVRDAALVRALIRATNEILRDAYSPTMPADEMLAAAERKLFALGAAVTGGADEPRPVGDLVREFMSDLDARIASGGGRSGLSSGYPDIDTVTGGFGPGELTVLGARPSVGKTALVLNILERIAGVGTPALFFSLEMPGPQIAARLLAMRSGVPMSRMTCPRDLRRDDIDAVFRAGDVTGLGGMPLYVADKPDLSAAQVAAVARRQVRRNGVRIIGIDYLGLMRPENPHENKTQQIGTLALRAKQMARALEVPVILLSQLNRESEGQARRPRLSDLRESGDIEAHADRVILLHRDPALSMESAIWPIDLLIAKNRNGPIGDVRLAYRRPVMRFENAAIEVPL